MLKICVAVLKYNPSSETERNPTQLEELIRAQCIALEIFTNTVNELGTILFVYLVWLYPRIWLFVSVIVLLHVILAQVCLLFMIINVVTIQRRYVIAAGTATVDAELSSKV